MEMAKYILSILRTQLMVVFSWGLDPASFRVIENGLAFNVEGYKHQGRVEVVYDEGWDLFIVRTINQDGTIKEQEEGIYVDGLAGTIDNMVEKTDDYSSRVKNQYGL